MATNLSIDDKRPVICLDSLDKDHKPYTTKEVDDLAQSLL